MKIGAQHASWIPTNAGITNNGMKSERSQKITIAILAVFLLITSSALIAKIFNISSIPINLQSKHGSPQINSNEPIDNRNTNAPVDTNLPTAALTADEVGITPNYQPTIKDGMVIFTGKPTISKDLDIWVTTINDATDPINRCNPNCSTNSKSGESWTVSIPDYIFSNGINSVGLSYSVVPEQSNYGKTNINFSLNIPELKTISVAWLTPSQTMPVKTVSGYIGTTISTMAEVGADPGSNEPSYMFVGSVTSGEYTGDRIYRIDNDCTLGCNSVDVLAVADSHQHKFHILTRYSSYWSDPQSPLAKISDTDDYTIILDLEAPAVIKLKKDGYVLTRMMSATGLADQKNAKKIGTAADGTIIYQYDDNRPAIRLKNGELIKYEMTIPFFDGRIPSITWIDGTTSGEDYSQLAQSGCGGTKWVIEPDSFKISSLIIAGRTANGDDVYITKDHSDVKALYDNWLTWMNNKDSYEQFLAQKPIFYWFDPFGRLVQWTTTKGMPQAECGKPVVYLYPTQTEQVSVKLGNNIIVKKSAPEYAEGWKVAAQPNGTLTTADGKTYPNLYWDGVGASYTAPTTGFVVAAKDVEATFKDKLSQLGLNAKEISDFNDFWLPIVTKSPYALISFVPQAEWSQAAPLAISPAPETMIRVFMDWKPLAFPINVAPQVLPPTPKRTGFIAVEWGGLLYK